MSEPWTPGPWEVQKHETPKGDGISLLRLAAMAEGRYIAWMSIQQEKEADARLIAAAPEMAALLERAKKHRGIGWDHPDSYDGAEIHREISALLARIRGEA